jgi:hypothetical protein
VKSRTAALIFYFLAREMHLELRYNRRSLADPAKPPSQTYYIRNREGLARPHSVIFLHKGPRDERLRQTKLNNSRHPRAYLQAQTLGSEAGLKPF